MRIKLVALLLLALPVATMAAQSSPVGRWKTFDDESGKAMSIVEIYEAKNGMLAGRVVETLDKPNALCGKCQGADKNKPIVGMNVLWDLKKTGNDWGGGKGFKPSTGDSFNAKNITVIDGGTKLKVTGCKMMFCKHPTWTRVP